MKELTNSKKEKDTVKLPKPVLQKFTEGDDIESFLDMFERVASLHKRLKTIWATQLAGVLEKELRRQEEQEMKKKLRKSRGSCQNR